MSSLIENLDLYKIHNSEDVLVIIGKVASPEGNFAKRCMALAEYFGAAAQPELKDIKRANELFIKYQNNAKQMERARDMARKITSPDKAYRRALIFARHPKGGLAFAVIFMNRCWELINGGDK